MFTYTHRVGVATLVGEILRYYFLEKLEVFIEHIPRADRLQARMQLHLCRCASNRAAIAYLLCSCMAIAKVRE